MEQEGFTILDVKSAIHTGRILVTQRHGGRPRKFVVRGKATDGRRLHLVCRLTSLRRLRVITVFSA